MRRFIHLLSLMAAGLVPTLCHGQVLEEYQVKAGYLLNIAKFTDWPGEANVAASEPFTVCVIGLDPFGHWLDDTTAVESPKGRRLQVRRIADARESIGCQVVFVSSSERKRVGQILGGLEGHHVLTIGDCDAAVAAGVIVNFTREDMRIRFEINTDSAEKQGLHISPRLLSLARIVKSSR